MSIWDLWNEPSVAEESVGAKKTKRLSRDSVALPLYSIYNYNLLSLCNLCAPSATRYPEKKPD